jgi:hypothetical protein
MRARRLLDEVGSPWLKVVIDPANLLDSGTHDRLAVMLEEARYGAISSLAGVRVSPGKGEFLAMLDEAFDWLGEDIALAHAKNPRGIEETFDLQEFEEMIRGMPVARSASVDELLAKLATEQGRQEFRSTHSWWPFYQPYLHRLAGAGFQGALVIHDLKEDEVKLRTTFLRELITTLETQG